MKLLLELLKKILSRLSNSYTKEEADGALSLKLGIEEFDDGLAESSDLRVAGDSALIQKLEANKANDDALANVVKWKTYAIAMQKMVDENLAIQIAEEFEKAAQKYLEDPDSTEEWRTTKDSDGNISSTCPYYETAPTMPVIDFNVTELYGVYNLASVFNTGTNVPLFLPNVVKFEYSLLGASSFNAPVILPNAVNVYMCLRGTSFNFPISLPKAEQCGHLLSAAKKFNSRIYAPVATNFAYSLQGAESFNQLLDLPKVTSCNYMLHRALVFNSSLNLPKAIICTHMLYDASSFNQPLSLPSATNCSNMLQGARAFNQLLDLPNATNCEYMLYGATAFNQPFTLPKAMNCRELLSGATAFNQAVSLPSASDCLSAFDSTAMGAENISATLDTLPTWTDGESHVITFTGSPGAAELTQESPSVANAIAKGWTVEL